MGLLGSNFRDYVVNQVNIRQKEMAIGYQSKGNFHPSYKGIKNKQSIFEATPWMRLMSGVRITKGAKDLPGTSVYEQIKELGLLDGIPEKDWKWSGLAQRCVLQGTVNSKTGRRAPKSAVGVSNDTNNENYPKSLLGAYGWGYNETGINSERGYVPPPGVVSVDFGYKNDGALAQATVNIKAFSKEQFAILDILYMRPGYTLLLEFGHTVYKNNKGETVYVDTAQTLPRSVLFGKNSPPSNAKLLGAIDVEKEKWNGNYEGFFGRITKFNWKYNSDGSYDITVKLTGAGDVISSLNCLGAKSFSKSFSVDSKFEVKPESEKAEIELVKEDSTFDNSTWAGKFGNWVVDNAVGLVETVGEVAVDSYNYVVEEGIVFGNDGVLTNEEMEAAAEEGATVIANAFKSQLNFDLYTLFADTDLFNDSSGVGGLATADSRAFPLPLKNIPIDGKEETFTINHGVIKFDVFEKGSDPIYSPTTLVTFGGFLAMLQKVCNVTDGRGSYFLEFELVNNVFNKRQRDYMVTYPGNFSCDPNKVLIGYKDFNQYDFIAKETSEAAGANPNATWWEKAWESVKLAAKEGTTLPSIPEDTIINTLITDSNKPKVFSTGRFSNSDLVYPLANVYVNINMIANLINQLGVENEEEQLEIPILALVDAVLNEINLCCGGINEFRTIFNEDSGKVNIISETPALMVKRKNPTTINTSGFDNFGKGDVGSFVKSIDLNSELSDQMATQIAIGAQANGNTMSGGATAFSAYSKGLLDSCFIEKKSNIEAKSKSKEEKDSVSTQIAKIWKEGRLEEAFKEVYDERNFDEGEYIDTLRNAGGQISSLMINQYFQTKSGPAPFFLPFNMSLTLKGLGGLRIYDGFKIDGKSLPLSYNPKDIKLIIKSLSHSVTVESWDTKISTISTVDNLDVKPNEYKKVGTSSSSPRSANSGGGGSSGPQINSPYKGKILDGDQAPIINPQGIGASFYSTSQLAKKVIADGGRNGLLKQTNPKFLVFIGEYNGANFRYPNPKNNNKPEYMLHPAAAKAWFKWRAEMKQKKIAFRVSSAYRSVQHQKGLGSGSGTASPGSSPHGFGGALDFGNLYRIVGGATTAKPNLEGRKTEAYKQIAEIGAKYGWYNPKRLADNYGTDEIWHFEYWGPA